MPTDGVAMASASVGTADVEQPEDDVISVSSASSASAPTTCPRNTERDELFIEGFVVVYTDGACSNNQERAKRVAGVGAFWGRKHPFNVSTPLDGHVQTNNRSELTAVIRVLQIELRNIDIRSDSAYVVDGMRKRLEKWRRQGFASKAGAIKNHDLWMQLSRLLQERPPGSWKLTKVKVTRQQETYSRGR